jgi:hypothetical protein
VAVPPLPGALDLLSGFFLGLAIVAVIAYHAYRRDRDR